MHFYTMVLVTPDAEGNEENEVDRLMAPFDENSHGAPQRVHLDESQLEYYGADEIKTDTDGDKYIVESWNENGKWDWYQIGGRWTGLFEKSYDPTTDPRNIEVCNTCEGTGTRKDWPDNCTPEWIAECKGCNGCQGKGTRSMWPTQWSNDTGCIAKVSELDLTDDAVIPCSLVTPDGEWIETDSGIFEEVSDDWKNQVKSVIERHPEAIAVVVDCHS